MELEPSRRRASLRASDADREQIVYALRQHHGDGRLTVSEFTERMSLAYEARTLGDLEGLTTDLPPLPPPPPERPDPVRVNRGRFYQHLLTYTCVNGFMVLLWVVTSIFAGRALFFWPIWTLLGWGLALGSHAIRVFGPQLGGTVSGRRGDGWDRRQDPWGRRSGHGPDDPRGGSSRRRVYR
jgi:DUF1707 SHOCT-like domain/2TM domain